MSTTSSKSSEPVRHGSSSDTGLSSGAEISPYDSVSQADSRRSSVITHIVLSENLKEHLREAYKGYNITFTDSKQTSDHSYAAASRAIERRIMIDMAKESGDTILVVGANITAMLPYVLDSKFTYHMCCPIIAGRDTSRHIDHTMKMNFSAISEEQLARVKGSVCYNKCQDCGFQAHVGVFCHSIYDMTPEQVADIMDKHGLSTAYGTLVFSSEILVNDKGVLPIINMHYQKNKGEDAIYMDFKNDSSTGYRHSLSNYIALMTQMIYVSSGNVHYSVEFTNNINGIQFFKIARTAKIVGMTYRTLWLSDEDKVCVRLPVRKNCIYDDDDDDEIDFEWVAFPRMLVDDTRSYLDKLSLEKIDIMHIYIYNIV